MGWSNYGLGEWQPLGETKADTGAFALPTELFSLGLEGVDATALANKRGESLMMLMVEGGSGSDGQVL